MTYLLDTNIVSELRKRDPDPRVLAWYEKARPAESVVLLDERDDVRVPAGNSCQHPGVLDQGRTAWSAYLASCSSICAIMRVTRPVSACARFAFHSLRRRRSR